jgi:hypothetical protein
VSKAEDQNSRLLAVSRHAQITLELSAYNEAGTSCRLRREALLAAVLGS